MFIGYQPKDSYCALESDLSLSLTALLDLTRATTAAYIPNNIFMPDNGDKDLIGISGYQYFPSLPQFCTPPHRALEFINLVCILPPQKCLSSSPAAQEHAGMPKPW